MNHKPENQKGGQMKDSFTERSKKLSEELERHILADKNILVILDIMDRLNLSDCWLCAGTIRNFIWNQYSFDEETDVDLVFFDENISYEETMEIESDLYQNYPAYRWELKNQVYMHIHSPNTKPYQSSRDAIEKFPERCTAIGICRTERNKLEIFAPFGLDDIYAYQVRATPHFLADPNRMELYRQRILKKQWKNRWLSLTVKET